VLPKSHNFHKPSGPIKIFSTFRSLAERNNPGYHTKYSITTDLKQISQGHNPIIQSRNLPQLQWPPQPVRRPQRSRRGSHFTSYTRKKNTESTIVTKVVKPWHYITSVCFVCTWFLVTNSSTHSNHINMHRPTSLCERDPEKFSDCIKSRIRAIWGRYWLTLDGHFPTLKDDDPTASPDSTPDILRWQEPFETEIDQWMGISPP
jgi:hypothetical protein